MRMIFFPVDFEAIFLSNLGIVKMASYPFQTTPACVCALSHSVVSDSCDPIDCSLPGSSVHGISQARILELVAISFSRRSSRPRNQTQVSCIAGRFFTN